MVGKESTVVNLKTGSTQLIETPPQENGATAITQKYFVKIGLVVPEICSRTDTRAHTHTDRHAHRNSQSPHARLGWRRGVVVSGVRRMNEVNARRARLVPGMGDRLRAGIPSRYVTSQVGQISLHPSGVA